MPKFGLKCFLGSFIFSLVAVVAATKAYFVLLADKSEKTVSVAETETKNIELFAVNEENDPILEKYHALTQQNDISDEAIIAEQEPQTEVESVATKTEPTADDILFAPENDEEPEQSAQTVADNTLPIVDAAVLGEPKENKDVVTPKQEDELKIVDAAEAKVFEIPLVHSFAPQDEAVKVSQKAESNQLALATDDVPLENLGATSAPTVQMAQNDDPWEVAEVANKNAARNQNAEIPDTSKPTTGNSVPYKMQKNILIPIPDEIANEKNLTPQFSSSAENIKLEEELRRKRGLPPINSENGVQDKATSSATINGAQLAQDGDDSNLTTSPEEENVFKEEDSGSLTDSIAAWFSGGRKDSADKNKQDDTNSTSKAKSGQQESSLFRKLLGLGAASKDNIAPTELKLSFQPDRAEISGQTLEWIKAFSENVVKYDDVAIEIRLDRDAPYELQQKRLNLLYKILANNGVEYRKVNIIFTDREPNSFIIRNVRYVTKEEKAQLAEKQKSPWY